MTNEEMLLRALNGEATADGAVFQPQNNRQAYLAYLVGFDVSLPEPRTIEEALLYKLCMNRDGDGGDEIDELGKDGVYEGPLSKVASFVAAKGLDNAMCVAEVDGTRFNVRGRDLAGHFGSVGFVAEDIVRFEYPT